ncbi:hypothetical protein [Paenibacillus sp. LK1]|uniref:hypothetical protein n=1 Tax=Paenibacillus sp. LK1 TaxID=2053014 RepID=UPI000C19CFEE|nr:hypothetical protein [Paenibacillus sp. LK1]PIH59683.1 hypothetical protein CS562_07015 [Paenibacillus sp. LK1]
MSTTDIISVGVALANGEVGKYSVEESNQKYREALNKLTGSENGEFDPKKFRKNKIEIFEIIEEVIDARVEEGIKDELDRFVDVRSVKFGDKLSFLPESDELFHVSEIAGGTNNLSRQRLTPGRPYQVKTGWEGVKIYEELERFLAGYIDWMKLISLIERSFGNKVKEKIFSALNEAYDSVSAPYSYAGTWDIEEFNDIITHLEAATGLSQLVLGTRKAVRKAIPSYVSNEMMNNRNQAGYFDTIDGVSFAILPQRHKAGSTELMYDDDFLLIIPNGEEKIIKLIFEGETIIEDNDGSLNADMSKEYFAGKKFGVGVLTSAKFGVYKLS